jgi:hypothetical protein
MKKLLVIVCFSCLFVSMLPAQELQNGVRNAVNNLAIGFMRPIDVIIGEITYKGRGTKSDFSRYLCNLIKTQATTKITSFKIINVDNVSRGRPKQNNEPQRGIITGTYELRNDKVEVFLSLVSDIDGESLSPTQHFSFPFAELSKDEQKSFLEPENSAVVEKREEVFEELGKGSENQNKTPGNTSPANQGIKIQAMFNSESMTYFHRDELGITLMADRNCYFKVIHIDAANQMKMIYPTSADKNNFLRANTPRAIFETARYIITEPYGEEVILVVTSAQQFTNIERDYMTPWVLPATVDTVRSAVRRGRGGDTEPRTTPITFSGDGEAKYTITILTPDVEYSYKRPADMINAYQDMKKDILSQGGYFIDGNEYGGYYIIGGVRGSYHVSRNAQDTIQFAEYYMDKYTRGPNTGMRSRGSGFTFDIDRPGNITQTIRTVRSEIEGCGGTFTGNEQEGKFQAKGITGQYRVANLVNVTITEKPFVIPNSMIEKEVRSYFSGK